MAKTPGLENMTIAVRTETKSRFDAFCEEHGFKKQEFMTRGMDFLMSLTEYELIEIYVGRMTAQKRRAIFRDQVLDALKENEQRRSDQKVDPEKGKPQHGRGG